MNKRKRLITTLALSVLPIGFFATGAGWPTARIQRVSAEEPLRVSARLGMPMLVGTHTLVPIPQLSTLTDRCSKSVRIEPSLIFDANQTSMVPGNQAPIRLKRPKDKNAFTAFTEERAVGLTSSGRFKWFCGSTANNQGGTLEHSNCPKGTNAMSARLGPDRLLEIRCHPD